MNHILIYLRTLIEALDIEFHILQSKYGLIDKEIPSFLLIEWVPQVEDTPHTISDLLAVFDKYLCIYLSINYVKFDRS